MQHDDRPKDFQQLDEAIVGAAEDLSGLIPRQSTYSPARAGRTSHGRESSHRAGVDSSDGDRSLLVHGVAPIVGARYTGRGADHLSPRAPRILGGASRR